MRALTEQSIGFTGVILDVREDHAEGMANRLRELGFTKGEELRILGIAPFGEPVLVELRGAIVALRKKEAACIKV
ncbi:MAG: ferrous iron transport protein A [Bdellovibrionales bacterium]